MMPTKVVHIIVMDIIGIPDQLQIILAKPHSAAEHFQYSVVLAAQLPIHLLLLLIEIAPQSSGHQLIVVLKDNSNLPLDPVIHFAPPPRTQRAALTCRAAPWTF